MNPGDNFECQPLLGVIHKLGYAKNDFLGPSCSLCHKIFKEVENFYKEIFEILRKNFEFSPRI